MKAHCPRCDGERTCLVHGSFDQPWSHDDDYGGNNGQLDHRLLQCRGCEQVFYWQSSWNAEDIEYEYNARTGEPEPYARISVETYPTPEKEDRRPDWSWSLSKRDKILGQIMDEVYKAADQNSFILASIGLRTALDRITEMLGVGPELPFVKKVEALFSGGWVGETERQTLEVVADAGSAAAHRGWSPDRDGFLTLLTTVEQFIHRGILTGKKALESAPQVPKRARSQREGEIGKGQPAE